MVFRVINSGRFKIEEALSLVFALDIDRSWCGICSTKSELLKEALIIRNALILNGF